MNKSFKYVATSLLVVAGAMSAHAQTITVNWGAQDVTGVSLAGTTNGVPAGDLIEIGAFTNGAPTVGSPSLANFKVFGTSTLGSGGNDPGFWAASTVANQDALPTLQIHVVAFNAPTIGAATQEGIFTFNGSAWKFPHSTDIPNMTTIDIEDMLSNPGNPGATLKPGAQIVFGSGPVYDSADGYSFLQLRVIPEPATIVLVGFSFAALAFLRRRRA